MHEDPAEPTDPTDATGADGSDPVQIGIEQFQRAALEAIRAGRAVLDAAESVLQDPNAAEAVVRTVGTVARNATEAVVGFANGRWPTADTPRPGDATTDPADDAGDEGPPDGFERITVA